MLRWPKLANYSEMYLKMTKKCSIFEVVFRVKYGPKWGILAKNRNSRAAFALSFAENRTSISLFVLEIIEFKVRVVIYSWATRRFLLDLLYLFVVSFFVRRKVAVTLKVNNFSSIVQIPIKLYIFGMLRVFGIQLIQIRWEILWYVTSRARKPGVGEKTLWTNRKTWTTLRSNISKTTKAVGNLIWYSKSSTFSLHFRCPRIFRVGASFTAKNELKDFQCISCFCRSKGCLWALWLALFSLKCYELVHYDNFMIYLVDISKT